MLKIQHKEKLFMRMASKNTLKTCLLAVGLISFNAYSQTDSVGTPPPPTPAPVPVAPTTPPGEARTIKGKILDKTGEPVVGAAVAVKGTNIAAFTDVDGNYTLNVPAEYANGNVVVSLMSYKTVELPIATTTNFDITLEEDSKLLDEVVVVGYGTQEKADVTGAISSVKGEDLAKVVVTDASQAIQGRAPGVTVTQNTGSPGSPLNIRIRGVGTIGNSNPLFVVNGVPVNDISYLHTNDIESIDILKDASAAAIYGSRAANGVVLVTTKKGSARKTTFEFNALTGISKEWKRYKLLDATEWATLKNEALMANGQAPLYSNPSAQGAGTDWQDQIFTTGKLNSYNLAASGATDKSTYYLGGGYLGQKGIVKNSNYERFTFNVNTTTNVGKRFTVGAFSNIAYTDRLVANDNGDYESVIASALSIDPLTPVYSTAGIDTIPFAGGLGSANNPVARINIRDNRQKGINYLGSFYGEYKILKYIKLKSQLGFQYNNNTTSDFLFKYFVKTGQALNRSSVIRDATTSTALVWENSAAFEKTIAEKHKFGALILWGIQDNRSEYTRVERTNTSNNDPTSRYFDAATTPTASAEGTATENAILSYLGRINYEFRNKYLLTANIRRDESSRFPKANRAGYFPSIAAGWKISEEPFFAPLKPTVSFAKIRAGWGNIGNQNVGSGDYPYTNNLSTGQNYSFNNAVVTGIAPRTIGNPNITWEKVTTSNIALDLGLFRDRLLFTVDYFTRTTSDMLLTRNVPSLSGLEQAPTVNGGKITNRGVELSTELRNNVGRLSYRLGANITFIKNKVVEIGTPLRDGTFRGNLVNITQEGGSIGEFYGFQTDGIVQTQEEAALLQRAQLGVAPGDFKYKDQNGDGVITDADRTTLGSPIPKFTYGFNADASYRNFDVVLFFQGVQGNKIFNGSKYVLESSNMGENNNKSEAMLDRWTGPGTSNERPRVSVANYQRNEVISNYYVENGSYLRLKMLQIGYTIPEAVTTRIKMSRVRVFVGAQNLLTFTAYSGLDPEIGSNNYSTVSGVRTPSPLDFGIDRGGNYPQARTWQIGINAAF